MDFMALAAAKAYTDKKISESGGSSLIAGDLLEIKDSVVRCTLGDLKYSEIKEEFEETYGTHTLAMEGEDGLYTTMIGMSSLPSDGEDIFV